MDKDAEFHTEPPFYAQFTRASFCFAQYNWQIKSHV